MQPKTPKQYKEAYERHKKAGNKDNAARVAQLYRQHLAQQQSQVAPEDRDNAFQFSIDQAQKMYGGAVQNVGRIAGSPSIEQYGKQVSDKQDQDIAKGGYQSNYSSARDSYEKEGLSGVAKWATEGAAENAVSGGAALVGTVATLAASVYSAPVWLVGALGAGTLVNSYALGSGDNVLEQQEKTGDFDARVATGVGIISSLLDRVGAKRAIPDDLLSKMTTEEVIGELMSQGKVSAAKEFTKRIGAEAVTETAQEALNMGGTALVGGDYTAQEVKDRALDSFLLGGVQAGAMNTGISTLSSAANLVKGSGKKSSKQTERQDQAQASFAQRLAAKVDDSQNADGPAYDLRDVDPDSRSGAKAVIDSVHTDMAAQLKTLVNLLKSRLKPEKTDPLNVVLDKSEAAVAAVKAKNKVKNVVDASDFKAFENLVGDTAEGQLAINLMHELNELTRVYSDGLTGGVSRYTDAMSPVGALDNYSNTGGVMQQFARPLATVALATANPGLAAAQVGTFTAGRAIDKVTGKRSRVGTYVAKNQNNPAQPVPTQPSLRNAEIAEQQAAQEAEIAAQAAAEQRAAEEREANLDLVQRGAPPLLGSPEDIFRDGTGLDRSGLAQVIRILKANPNTKVATRRAIEAYETSIATGGRVDFTLIRNINSLVDQFPQLKQLQVRPRNQATADQAIQQQYSQQQQNYERGIENNRQFATQLTDALNADKSVQPIHKALLLDSLGQMQLDLGANPVSRLQAMEDRLAEKGVPVEAVQQYFAPYIERVVAQQEAKQSLNNTEQAVDDDADPVNDSKGITLAGKVKILREQYEENPNSKEARRAYLDARDARDASGDFGEEVTPDYKVQHQAPVSDDDTPLHILDQVMPDFYARPRDYKTGSKLDSKTLDILQQLKGKPEQIVKVYRAVPKDAPDTINYGDWVTVNKQYAEDHGEGMPEGYKIIEGAAPAKNIKTNGDSIHEFGYAQNKVNRIPIYHSTNEKFEDFDLDKSADNSIWFSDNLEKVEQGYDGASGSAYVVTRYIDENKLALATRDQEDKMMHFELQQMGYDGVKYTDSEDTVYQIYNPEKLQKTVLNNNDEGVLLNTEDPVNNSVEAAFARVQEEYLQPTPAEIKEKLPEAEDIVNFTIGKKGTDFEDGVRSEDDIRRIATLLDISISVLNTPEEARAKSLSSNTRGQYGGKRYGTAGHINIKGENLIGRPQYIATLVHEVGHGVEGQTLDRGIADGALEKSPHPRGSKARNAVSYRHGSYREHMHFALKIAKGEEVYRTDLILPDYDEALEIRREIDHIQEALVALRFPGFAEGSLDTKGLVVRESVEKLIEDEAAETARRVINNGSSKSYEVIYENSKENMMREYGRPHIRYLKDTAEFAVDSVVLYLTDPQLMKLIAPVTAAYMRKIFKKSGMPVKFYASPLASVMAILLAGIAKGIGGEEEEQVPGALSMQPGLLST